MANKENVEVNVDDDADKLELEIVDDTPAEDQGRKPLDPKVAAEVDKADEVEEYSEGVKKRIGAMKHQYHDERRAREKAERERDEAVQIAQKAFSRSQQLEQQLSHGEVSYAGEVQEKAVLSVAQAKEKYRKAYDAGDPDALAEAAGELATASQAAANAKVWQAQAQRKVQDSLQKEKDSVDSQQQTHRQVANTPPKPDARAMEWARDNEEWFGKDSTMTSLVYGVHEKLVREEGLDPIQDADEYYSKIDSEMRKRYPEYDWQDDGTTQRAAPPTRKPKSAVAPVTRVPTGSKQKITLTKSQVAMAEKFGLTPEQYARELIKLDSGA